MSQDLAEPFRNNAEHLAAEKAWLNLLLGRAVREWRAQTPAAAANVFQGLYVSDQEIDALLAPAAAGENGPETAAASAARQEINRRVEASLGAGVPLALPQLARMFGLSQFEAEVVVVALAPELDLSYEKLFAYLQDDLSRKRPTIELALRLLCRDAQERVAARPVFAFQAPLFRYAVLSSIERAELPWLARPLILDEIAAGFLLGTGGLKREMAACLRLITASPDLSALRWPAEAKQNLRALIHDYARPDRSSPARLVCQFWGPRGSGKKALAAALCREAGINLLRADLRELVGRAPNLEDSLRDLFRHGIFLQSALYLEHLESLLPGEEKPAPGLRVLRRVMDEFSWLTFLATEKPWLPGNLFERYTFVPVELALPGIAEREQLWATLASSLKIQAPDGRWSELSVRFRFTPGQIGAALAAAKSLARLRGPDAAVTMADLLYGCYAESNQGLQKLARKLPLKRSWADLTLPQHAFAQMEEICAQVRYRRKVYEDWGFERRLPLGRGLCALFHGPSGVGKTMAVEIIARELQLEVYKIDLSTVVSKYIGETEKNLSRIFEEAETSNAILFFDEADALFGKRSEVKDAHDRYANIEINYLLQRVEEFDGLVILASNLRRNIDEGFFRRMHFAVEFPMPDAAHRCRIWNQHVPAEAPMGADVDFGFLASRFPVTGGNIKNIVLNAAFLAAEADGEIRMEHFIRATLREYEKLGRVCTDTEFAPYEGLLRETQRRSGIGEQRA